MRSKLNKIEHVPAASGGGGDCAMMSHVWRRDRPMMGEGVV